MVSRNITNNGHSLDPVSSCDPYRCGNSFNYAIQSTFHSRAFANASVEHRIEPNPRRNNDQNIYTLNMSAHVFFLQTC